jgi:hypothetical protein
MVSTVGWRCFSWVVGSAVALAGVLLLAVYPQPAWSEVVTAFQTTTTYTGKIVFDYSFEQDYNGAEGPVQFGDTDQDVYTWTEVDRDLIEPISFTKYKDTTYRNVVANGTRLITEYDTAPLAEDNGSATCDIRDDGKGEQVVGQQLLEGVPTVNPLTTVSWQVPSDVGRGGRIIEGGRGTGSFDLGQPCYGGAFLGFTTQCNVCVNYIPATGNQAEYATAWMGNATVHVRTLVRGFSKTFHAEVVWSQTTPPNANIISQLEQGNAQIDSRVTSSFKQIKMEAYGTLLEPPGPDCTKQEALVLDSAIDVLRGIGSEPPLGQHDRVLLPFTPTCKGTAKLDVSGMVLPSAKDRHSTRSARPTAVQRGKPAPIVLASSGTVHTEASWGSPILTLNLTSAGRRLLSGPHAAIAVAASLRIAPVGGRAWTITQHDTIPANP